jgi:hypothetical protein
MAWSFISELPISPDEYDALNAEIPDDPAGLILHTASRSEVGMRIIDVWESEDAYRRFEAQQLMPAIARIGAEPPPPDAPHPLEFEVYNMRRGA